MLAEKNVYVVQPSPNGINQRLKSSELLKYYLVFHCSSLRTTTIHKLLARLACPVHPPMLNITRRGLSSVARPLFSPSTYSRCKRPTHTQDLPRCLPRITNLRTVKLPSSTSGWRRSIATSAAAEDHATEGEIEQEVHSQTPPSDDQIPRAVKNGPVTKFAELAERGMVCQTLVKTVTETMGLETMTPVQSLTIAKSLQGQDM